MAGVIPPIFASSLLLFPATIASSSAPARAGSPRCCRTWPRRSATASRCTWCSTRALILFFCFFYTALVFNARDTAENLKKSGAFIPGIRPGQQTGEYIDKVLTRLTLWGALYMAGVCLMPEIMISQGGVPFQFGGTSLLIVVVVAMDFMAQLQAHMMSHQYPGLLKKANLLGWARRRAAVTGSGRGPRRESEKGLDHESSSVREEDLQELQDRAPQAHRLRDLQGPRHKQRQG